MIKNAQSLRQHVKNKSKKTGLDPQIVMQNYMIERLLERISVSKYRNNFVIKGGTLLSSIMGLENRATMDLDATLKGLKLSQESANQILSEILRMDVGDGVNFKLNGFAEIRIEDIYPGFRASITSLMEQMKIPLSIDMTAGDKITPREIEYGYKLLFEDREIKIMSYTLETVLSEKLHAILWLGKDSTRLRDYYDVHMLYNLHKDKFSMKTLALAFKATCERKNTLQLQDVYKETIYEVKNSSQMQNLWTKYEKTMPYVQGIEFLPICDLVLEIMEELEKIN